MKIRLVKRGWIIITWLFLAIQCITACQSNRGITQEPTFVNSTPSPTEKPTEPTKTIASTLFTKIQTPNPISTRIPDIQWNVEVMQVSWNRYNYFSSPGWLNNTIARVATYYDGIADGLLTVDLSTGPDLQVKPVLEHTGRLVYSPRNTFMIECHDPMKMIVVGESRVLSETPLPEWNKYGLEEDCANYINWSLDEKYAAYTDSQNDVYVWPSDGSSSRKIMAGAYFAIWSPDSSKLAVETTELSNFTGVIKILSPEGRELKKINVEMGDPLPPSWLTNQVLNIRSRYTQTFYEIDSGQKLFMWESYPTGNGIPHQQPRVSPNGRWVFIDQGMDILPSAVEANKIIVAKEYSLYDVQKKVRVPLVNHPGNYLANLGWNKDSSQLYLLSLPAESVSTSSPETPFGLLGYDPIKQKYTLLFPNAIQCAWNADRSLAFVTYAEVDLSGRTNLMSTFWNPATGLIIDPWQVGDEMVYEDPARGMFSPFFNGPLSLAWSHDGLKVALEDRYANILIFNIDGTRQLLAENSGLSKYYKSRFSWSPDDQHLLVEQDGQAWIIDMSNP